MIERKPGINEPSSILNSVDARQIRWKNHTSHLFIKFRQQSQHLCLPLRGKNSFQHQACIHNELNFVIAAMLMEFSAGLHPLRFLLRNQQRFSSLQHHHNNHVFYLPKIQICPCEKLLKIFPNRASSIKGFLAMSNAQKRATPSRANAIQPNKPGVISTPSFT